MLRVSKTLRVGVSSMALARSEESVRTSEKSGLASKLVQKRELAQILIKQRLSHIPTCNVGTAWKGLQRAAGANQRACYVVPQNSPHKIDCAPSKQVIVREVSLRERGIQLPTSMISFCVVAAAGHAGTCTCQEPGDARGSGRNRICQECRL